MREHAADDAVDLLLDEVEDLLVGQREHEEELAPLQVMDDVHALQDRARAHLPVPRARREANELLDGARSTGFGIGYSKWRRR